MAYNWDIKKEIEDMILAEKLEELVYCPFNFSGLPPSHTKTFVQSFFNNNSKAKRYFQSLLTIINIWKVLNVLTEIMVVLF